MSVPTSLLTSVYFRLPKFSDFRNWFVVVMVVGYLMHPGGERGVMWRQGCLNRRRNETWQAPCSLRFLVWFEDILLVLFKHLDFFDLFFWTFLIGLWFIIPWRYSFQHDFGFIGIMINYYINCYIVIFFEMLYCYVNCCIYG